PYTKVSYCTEALVMRLTLQSHFTWDLKKEDLQLDDLCKQLQHNIELALGQRGAVANAYSFLNQEPQGSGSGSGSVHSLDPVSLSLQAKHPVDSSTDLRPEVYGEQGWTFLKFSKSYYPRAIDCFRKALELQPENWEMNTKTVVLPVGVCRADVHLSSDLQNITETYPEELPATKQLRQALETNPDDGVLMSMLALKLLVHRKPQEAQRPDVTTETRRHHRDQTSSTETRPPSTLTIKEDLLRPFLVLIITVLVTNQL
uniref:Uncharacterized protein n=1 Tax=Seriola dumerili TaxID=41447 RepID=A0A3B4UP57_SERDU